MLPALKSYRALFIPLCLFSLALALVIAPGFGPVLQAQTPTPEEAVAQAWQLAQTSGVYAYRSEIDQTTYPAPKLTNTGRAPRQENLALAGRFDQWAETLDFTLWRDGSFNPLTGLSVRLENGETYARVGNGQWEKVDNITDAFAPGGDPLAFLTGITNIQAAGTQTYDYESESNNSVDPLPASPARGGGDAQSNGLAQSSTFPTLNSTLFTLNYTAYTFDLNGPAFATYVREALEKQLAAKGKLPRGMDLELPETYRRMTGSGTLWVDANGLPARLQIVMDLGAQANGERVTATLQTDFSDFDLARIKQATTPLTVDPGAWWQARLQSLNATAVREWSLNLSAVLFCLGAGYCLLNAWRQRRAYAVLMPALVFGMVITPLLDAENAFAFSQEQQAQQAAQQAAAAQAAQQTATHAAYKNRWDPHANPLEVNSEQLAVNSNQGPISSEQPTASTVHFSLFTDNSVPQNIRASAAITSTDTDNDGLSDADEYTWLTCAYAGASYCTGVTASTDSDGDGLSDGTEVNTLGTLPTYQDTDGDAISDTLEVKGFAYNGVQWYLDPNNTDTNEDGLVDSADCPVWALGNTSFNVNGICPDTDDDGTPDVFDEDNDGDEVPDSVDTSPTYRSGTYTDANPFELAINGLQTNKPVMLTLQLRPTSAEHLTYSGLVLDWPSNDTAGQITRRLDTTFATTANAAIQSTSDNAANGDVRVIPILELTMPYSAGHYANLPVKSPYYGVSRTLGITVGQWLNTTELDPYGINVRDADTTSGELVAYLPLSTVAADSGDETVAFTTQMIYSPTQSNWGAAHEFRVIWLVQMITDECIDPTADEATCARQDMVEVINTYTEEWELTGVNVTEEHGLKVGVMLEDPTQDVDLKEDDQLWAYSWNLGNAFINGRDCDTLVNGACQGNGTRDVSLSNLASKLTEWGEGGNYVDLYTYSYIHSGYISSIMMTETASLLAANFTAYTDTTYPTFLFAQERTQRALNADDDAATLTGDQLTLNFNGETTYMGTALSWATYQYAAGTWANMDKEDYLTYLDSVLQLDSFFAAVDASEDSIDEAEGKRIWAQVYYLALANGLSGLAEINNAVYWTLTDTDGATDLVYVDLGDFLPSGIWATALIFHATFKDAIANIKNISMTSTTFWKEFKAAFSSAVADEYGLVSASNGLLAQARRAKMAMAVFAVGASLAIIGVIFYAIGHATGNATLAKVGEILMAVSSLILETVTLLSLISKVITMAGTSAMTTLVRSLRVGAIVGFVISVLVIWGTFLYAVLSGSVKTGTVQFELLLAYSIAATIVAMITLLLLIALPVVGAIIMLIIGLIDLILYLIGIDGISDRVTQAIADMLYDVDMVISNLADSDRMALGNASLDFANAAAGFVETNGLYYTATVTNTIESYEGEADARRATFVYVMQQTDADQDDNLAQNQMPSAWTLKQAQSYSYGYGLYGPLWITPTLLQLTRTTGLTLPVLFSTIGTGLNQNFSGHLYLTESYAAPYQGCWKAVGYDVKCTWYDFTNSNHLNLGADITFDILPASLDDFVDLGWNEDGALSFPTQTDQDGDGLLSPGQGGTDPNDTAVDTDGDSLSDEYEIIYGLDAEDADADDDGLTDAEEVAAYTDPLDADSDDDGLPDYTELKTGWLIVYAYNGSTPLLTRVWSDPNFTDADNDTLTDLEEFTFGFNPWVTSDPSTIKDIIQFDNMGVDETDAALSLWRFEEGAAVAAFADSSGHARNLTCNRDAGQCPTAEQTGRYGDAILLDGNDYLTSSVSITLAKGDFSIGAWVKTTANSNQAIVVKNDDDTSWEQGEKAFYLNNTGLPHFVGWGNEYIRGTQAVNDGQWHHVMVVWDYSGSGTSGTGKMYVDGADVTNASTNYFANKNDNSTNTLKVGRPNYGEAPNHFNGGLDEVIVYNRALTATEVSAVYAGRYNANDGLLAPGQDLSYHATVTNTSSTQSAHGFLVADSTYVDPEVAEPDLLLRFENADYVYEQTNGVGESYVLTCVNDGTCPITAQNGQNGQALDFDGVNDALVLPALSDIVSNHSLAFWLKLDALPSSGQTQLIATSRTDNGAVNVYMDTNGKLWFTIAGNVGNYYLGYYTSTVGFNWSGAHYASRPMSTIVGTWTHFMFIYNGTSSRIYINGNQDSTLSYTTAHALLLGPGALGNNVTGTAPLNGKLDEFVVYDNQQLSDGPNAYGYSDIDLVMGGAYWLYEDINNVGDVVPTALFQFGDELGYNGTLFYDTNGTAENAYCSSPNCPTYTTAGYSGAGVVFDGSNDYLTTDATATARNIGQTFYIKMNTWPASGNSAYVLDSTSGVDVSINSSGKVVVANTPNGNNLVTSGSITVGTWVKVYVEFTDNVSGCTWGYRAYVYINDVKDTNYGSYHCSSSNHSYQMTFGPGRIGRTLSDTYPLSGTLDGVNFGSATYAFEVNDPPTVTVRNAVEGDNATCPASYFSCPTVTTGKYGNALAFTGDDHLTFEDERTFDYSALSVGAWIKVAPGGFTSTWQAIVTKGDSAWRLHRSGSTSRVAFSTSGLSNVDMAGTSNVDDGQWHYVMGVYDGAAKYLFVDGVLENYAKVTGTLAKNNYAVYIGENAQITGRKFVGSIDEVVVLPAAVYTDGVRALMNGIYPPIAIANDFITYTTAALASTTVNGTATVETTTTTSEHLLTEEVEAALALQSAITIPVVDNSSANLTGYFPFEDVPGVSTFENLMSANDAVCASDNCPTAGLRGISDRAVYFDGVDDVLTTSTGLASFTIAAWVKADSGTIVDGFESNLLRGVQLDVNRLYFRIRDSSSTYTRYTLNYDLPENTWTHVVATLDTTNKVASIYLNGSVAVTTSFTYNSGYSAMANVTTIGANRFGGDYLHGYLGDLRLYNTALSASAVQTLYGQSTPALRFEFDEDDTATTYADASPYGAVGTPSYQTCADFTLNTATVNSQAADAVNLYVKLSTDWLLYDTFTNAVASATRNLDSVICATTPMTVGIVTNSGVSTTLGTVSLNPATAGTTAQTFSSGGNSITLNWKVGVSYAQPNPAPGTDGQIGNTALFDGSESYITVAPTLTTLTNSVGGLTNSLTILAWINPDNVAGLKRILATGRATSNNGFGFGLVDDGLRFTTFSLEDFDANNIELEANLWQHVAVVFDSSYDAHFYVDGVLEQTVAGAYPATRNTDDPLYIGTTTGILNTSWSEMFGGQIDELAVYSRTLSSAEIYSIYLRELRWYRANSATQLTIDADAPTVELLSDYAYRANGYTQLAVSAVDATTDIALVDFGLKQPGAASFSWAGAEACLDAAAVWCPSFNSSTLGGEGAYQMQFRAVDSVGNQTTTGVYTLYVDSTAPTASSLYNNTWLNAITDTVDDLAWTIALTGTISDPTLSGGGVGSTPGSGVNVDTVLISLKDARGELLGDNAQPATVVGTSWSISYTASGLRPSGVYTLSLSAEDNVGNAMTATLGTVRLDERAPAVQFAAWAHPTTTLTTTAMLTGVVGDYADWGGERVQFHFEEAAGSAYDYSGFGYVGGCITCPTQTTGVFGSARLFTATARTAITVPASVGFEFTNATLAAWVKPTWTSGSNGYNPAILAVRDGSNTHLSWHLKDNYSRMELWNGSNVGSLPVTLAAGQWYHLALVMDNGVWTGYVNGVAAGTITQSFSTKTGLPLNIGSSTGSAEFFTGALDEVTVFDRALSESEVYALAQKEVQGVSKVEVWPEVYAFTGSVAANWQTAALSSQNAPLTTWAYTLPSGLEDFYQINLRAQDGFSNTSSTRTVWRGIIDQVAPRVTFSATHLGGGFAAQTLYTLTVADKFLNTANLTQPCASAQLDYTTYVADETRISGVSASCRVNGHITGPVSVTACDLVSFCTTQTVTLTTSSPVSAVSILAPSARSTVTASTTISGGAYSPNGLLTVTVKADDTTIATLPLNGTDALWSTNWTPTLSKTYTLTAILNTQTGGPYTDVITVTAQVPPTCFAEVTGDNVTDYSSEDASALRNALAAASTGGTVKLAGTCPGVSGGQVAAITKTLTLRGGYTTTNWAQSYPLTQPTTLNAQGAGRVLSLTVAATLEGLSLTNGYALNGPGGGLYAAQNITLTNVTFISNTATTHGGGAYFQSAATITGGAFQQNTAGANQQGGGAYLAGAAQISGTQFISNTFANLGTGSSCGSSSSCGGGLFAAQSITLNNAELRGNSARRGGGVWFSTQGTVANSTFSQNVAGANGGGAYFYGAVAVNTSTFTSNTAQTGVGGGAFMNTTASVSGSTFNGNSASTNGGGIQFNTNATLTSTTFANNTGAYGGGVYFLGGTSQVTGTAFTTNTASSQGGGFYLNTGASLNLTNTTVVSNTATHRGGGAYTDGTLNITGGWFALNRSISERGGGLYQQSGTLTVNRSTFAQNQAGVEGGGVHVQIGAANVRDSSFLTNTAGNFGGGLYSWAATVGITNSTFSANTANEGGGLGLGAGQFTLLHTSLISNTAAGNGQTIYLASGGVLTVSNSLLSTAGTTNCSVNSSTLVSGGYNVENTTACGFANTGDLTNTAVLIAPLANNGGDTLTHALLLNSPAVDRIPNSTNGCGTTYTTDQRGAARPTLNGCDSGAYEAQQAALSVARDGTGGGSVASDPGGIDCGTTCLAGFNPNTVVTLTATPLMSSTFTGWSVSGATACSGVGSCIITMTAAQNVTATFALNTYTLTVTPTGSGAVTSTLGEINCGATCAAPFTHGTVVTLTATPDVGMTFAGWGGACSGTDVCVVTMDAIKEVTATFNP